MYQYQKERPHIFTEEGQRLFLRIRDRTNALLNSAGAARMDYALSNETEDSWELMACVDRLVELGELHELTGDVPGQNRVFIRGPRAFKN